MREHLTIGRSLMLKAISRRVIPPLPRRVFNNIPPMPDTFGNIRLYTYLWSIGKYIRFVEEVTRQRPHQACLLDPGLCIVTAFEWSKSKEGYDFWQQHARTFDDWGELHA